MTKICYLCKKGEIVHDKKMSGMFCTGCGECFELGAFTDDVQYREDERGRFLAAGTTYNVEKGFVNSKFSNHAQLLTSVDNAKTILKRYCDKLYISDSFAQISSGFYHQLLIKKFTNGRRLHVVLAACLYIAVRSEAANVILLDISDVSEANVYDIGRYYFQIIRILHFNIQSVDPSEYIVRFANMLDLGDRKLPQIKHLVLNIRDMANRLVQRMKRDWIHFGRRPSGVCAAAVLVAARINNVRCSIKDIVSIAKVCENTIRTRITEFTNTQSGKLTYKEFMSQDLDYEDDPPSFKISNEMKESLEANLEKAEKFHEIINEHLKDSRIRLKKNYTKFLKDILIDHKKDGDDEKLTIPSEENSVINETIVDQNILALNEKLLSKMTQELKTDDDNGNPSAEEIQYWAELRPSAQSLGMLKRERSETETKVEYEDLLEKGLEGLDEDEIDAYIIEDVVEFNQKKLQWTRLNKDYLENEEKEALKKMQQEMEKDDEKKPPATKAAKNKKKRRKIDPDLIEASSTSEAVEAACKANSIPLNDINLKELFNEGSSCSSNETKAKIVPTETVPMENKPVESKVTEKPIDSRLVTIYHSYAMKKSADDDGTENEEPTETVPSIRSFKSNGEGPTIKETEEIDDEVEDDYYDDEDDELNKIKLKYSIQADYNIGDDIEDCGF